MTDIGTALDSPGCWPPLPLREWQRTRDSLHMWTQIVGKIRLAVTPLVNHWWNVPLYVYPRGLTTSVMPYRGRGFEIRFDFVSHALVLDVGDDALHSLPLEPRSVADFHRALMALLRDAGIDVAIWTMPVEIPDPIRFEDDTVHASYDRRRRALCANTHHREYCVQRVSRRLHRQVQPGPFLLGELRPVRHAVLGPPRTAASRCRSCHAGSVLA